MDISLPSKRAYFERIPPMKDSGALGSDIEVINTFRIVGIVVVVIIRRRLGRKAGGWAPHLPRDS